MPLKLLIADPSQAWLKNARAFFESLLYEIYTADNGRDAQIHLSQQDFFATLINIKLESHSAMEVLMFIKKKHLGCKVIPLIADKDDFIKEQDGINKLTKMGIKSIVSGQYTMQHIQDELEGQKNFTDMLKSIPRRDGVSEEVEINKADQEFTQIPIENFISTKNVLFDVYIKLRQGKYVKILHAGDTFSKERLNKYKEDKKVSHLYFSVQDRRKYINFNNHLIAKSMEQEKISASGTVTIMRSTAEKVLETISSEGMRPQDVDNAKLMCKNVYQLTKKDKQLYSYLRKFEDLDPNAFTHAFAVSLFASAMVQKFVWDSDATSEIITMAAFFHDIGKLKMPKELIEKKPEDMDAKELEIYRMHPIWGAELLAEHPLVPNFVQNIIKQHHEASDGSGFPDGLKDLKIFHLAKIIFVADEFVHLMANDKISPIDAVKQMLADSRSNRRYNGRVLESLCNIFVAPEKLKVDNVMPSRSKMVPSQKG